MSGYVQNRRGFAVARELMSVTRSRAGTVVIHEGNTQIAGSDCEPKLTRSRMS